MNEIICIDETFDPNATTEYKLSVRLGFDGLSFCVLDDISNKFIMFKHFPFSVSSNTFLLRKVKEVVGQEEVLKNQYKSCCVNFVSPKFTLLPPVLENVDEYTAANLNFDIGSDESLASFSHDKFEGKIIYAFPARVADFLNLNLKNPAFFHEIKTTLSLFSHKIKPGLARALVSVNKKFLTIIVCLGGRMVFINSFNYTGDLDMVFYLLHVFKSLSLNTQDGVVYLAGMISEGSSVVGFIKKHFLDVDFLKLSADYQYSYTFASFSPQKFISVFNPEG